MGGTAQGRDRWGEGEQQRTRIEALMRGPCSDGRGSTTSGGDKVSILVAGTGSHPPLGQLP